MREVRKHFLRRNDRGGIHFHQRRSTAACFQSSYHISRSGELPVLRAFTESRPGARMIRQRTDSGATGTASWTVRAATEKLAVRYESPPLSLSRYGYCPFHSGATGTASAAVVEQLRDSMTTFDPFPSSRKTDGIQTAANPARRTLLHSHRQPSGQSGMAGLQVPSVPRVGRSDGTVVMTGPIRPWGRPLRQEITRLTNLTHGACGFRVATFGIC